jgi:hypothetical protein
MISKLETFQVADLSSLGQVLQPGRYLPRLRLGRGNLTLQALGLKLSPSAAVTIPLYSASSNRVLTSTDILASGYSISKYTVILVPGPEKLEYFSMLEPLKTATEISSAPHCVVVYSKLDVSDDHKRVERTFWAAGKPARQVIYVKPDEIPTCLASFEQIISVELVERGTMLSDLYAEELGSKFKPIYILLDQQQSIVDVGTGLKGLVNLRRRLDQELSCSIQQQFDHVVVSAGGLPYDRTERGLLDAVACVDEVVKPGGTVHVVGVLDMTKDYPEVHGPSRDYKVELLPKFYPLGDETELSGNVLICPLGRTLYKYVGT